MYDYKPSPKVERYIRKLKDKNLKKAFMEAIKKIRIDPSIGTAKKGDLAGCLGYDVSYEGINYEIAYIIDETEHQLLIIVLIGTRENFYKELKNYADKYM
jgi:mRNA interferase RelE/StbE